MKTKSYLAAFALIILLVVPGCSLHEQLPVSAIENKGSEFDDMTKSRAMSIVQTPYLGATAMELESQAAPILRTHVTLRFTGSIIALGDLITGLVPVVVSVESSADKPAAARSAGQPASPPTGPSNGIDPDLEALLASTPSISIGSSGPTVRINYEGPLRGLLNQIATQSGYGWDYDGNTNTVTFASMMIRTFTLAASPGEISYENQITNKSKENSGSRSIGGSNTNTTVSTEDSSTQTNQSNKIKLKHDVWKDTETAVKTMLSSLGKVVANQAAGTLTVRDRPETVRRIAAFIDDVNSRYSRQVSIRVNVWSLELTDDVSAGVDLQAIFQSGNLSIVSGALGVASGSLNTAAATVVSGKLKGSNAVISALQQWGHVTQVTSGGAVAMNNQPAPILNTTRYAYLAGMATETTDYGQTVELTPGEVTTGFAMTVVPHILENRKVVLNYTINLSSLDKMENFEANGTTIQLPQVSTRAFSQRVAMRMGQTLVLAGFAKSEQSRAKDAGFFSFGSAEKNTRTLLIVTMEVENASPELREG